MMDTSRIQAVIGLGNPGEKYRSTRHNVGYRVVEALSLGCEPANSPPPRMSRLRRFFGRTSPEGLRLQPGMTCTRLIGGRKISLFLPDRFMNRSGESIAVFLKESGLSLHEILVVVDDIDLPLGRIRLKPSGGPGTHNGLRNICEVLGTNFPRLRLGIHGDQVREKLADYVLSNFSPEEEMLLEEIIARSREIITLAIRDGLSTAMNLANRKLT